MQIDTPISYKDEFGEIDADVLREAENIRHYCRILALKVFNDEQKGQILMMRAVAKVSEKHKAEDFTINNLRAYLFQTFRYLVYAEAKKQIHHHELEKKHFESLNDLFQGKADSEDEKICRAILIKEIEAKMDEWTRNVYRYLELGWEYKDLVPKYGSAENVIRAKYSKKLKELAEIFREK